MLGDNIKIERKSHGLSQAQLAIKLHVTQGAISQWEKNLTRPDMDLLSQLSMLFNCSTDYLLGRSDSRVDDTMLDIVNEIPSELLEKYGNALDAYRAYHENDVHYVEKKRTVTPDQGDGEQAEWAKAWAEASPEQRALALSVLRLGLQQNGDQGKPRP